MSVLERVWENSEFYQLIKGYPGGVIIFGLRGEILEVNQVVEQLLGCPQSALYQKKNFDICSAESNAMEADILKNQAFVAGYTPLYEKKYELDGNSVQVTQHTYLIKDSGGKPMCMVAMLSPAIPDSDGATFNFELKRLKEENAKLKKELESSDRQELEQVRRERKQLNKSLAESREREEALKRQLVVKDKALKLKDAAIKKMEEAKEALGRELHDAKGALEVALIMESPKEDPEKEASPAAPFPLDEEEDKPIEQSTETEEIQASDDADGDLPTDAVENDPGVDAPWESDDVVYDDDVVKATAIETIENSADKPPESAKNES